MKLFAKKKPDDEKKKDESNSTKNEINDSALENAETRNLKQEPAHFGKNVHDVPSLANTAGTNLKSKDISIGTKDRTSQQSLVTPENTATKDGTRLTKITTQDEGALFDDPQTKKIIEIISGMKENTINPAINFEENQVSYPQLSHDDNAGNLVTALERLSSPSVDMLEKIVYERLPVCPEHPQYYLTSLRLYCSSCFSTDIVKLHLIEHKTCGYITEKRDLSVADMSKCLYCKNIIKDPEKEIRRLGRWYECNKCKVKFDNCVTKLHCRKFDHDFDINQANLVAVQAYKLKSNVKQFSTYRLSLLPHLQKMLMSYGCTVNESFAVKGKSGISHVVDIYATKDDKNVLIDVRNSETSVEDAEVNATLVKVVDISPTISIFIGMPSVTDTVKAIASVYNISVVTGKNPSEILETVDKVFKEHFPQ